MKLYKIFGALGTGKTEYLTNKLIESTKIYHPNEVLFVTYTRGGVESIKERLREKNIDPGIFPYIGTMHSICSRLIGFQRDQRMSNSERKKFVTEFMYQYKEEREENEDILNPEKFMLINKPFANACFAIISRCRCRRIPIERWIETLDEEENVPFTNDQMLLFYKRYQEYKVKYNKMDYDDVIEKVIEMELCPKGIKVMFFDEFQDFWEGLFRIYNIWKMNCEDTLYLAGDPNQTIYGFMGANHEYFMNEVGTDIILQVNYRCRKNIWNFAKNVVGKSSFYDISKIVAKEEGGTIIRSSKDMLRFIREKETTRTPCLILTRTIKQANNIYVQAITEGIPIRYTSIQGKISNQFLHISNFLIKLNSPNKASKIWSSIEVYDFVVNTRVGKAMLQDKVQSKFRKGLYKREDWSYLEVIGLFHYTYTPDVRTLAKIVFDELQYGFFQRFLENDVCIPEPVLQIGTMHSSKGRTIESVILLNEMPYTIKRKWRSKDLESEERRLLHVACGRAKKELILIDTWEGYPFL